MLAAESEEADDKTVKKSRETPPRNVHAGKDTKERRASNVKGAELIMPETREESHSQRSHLTIETLAGYGAAKDWALNLKEDLALWKGRSLDWADMSTKMLLSGPPGTGKTTFAKALCNTLQVPLYGAPWAFLH